MRGYRGSLHLVEPSLKQYEQLCAHRDCFNPLPHSDVLYIPAILPAKLCFRSCFSTPNNLSPLDITVTTLACMLSHLAVLKALLLLRRPLCRRADRGLLWLSLFSGYLDIGTDIGAAITFYQGDTIHRSVAV